ncbi:MAG TPA: hypothetical protein VF294_03225 [Polyangiaceae bacterium]
MPLSRFWLLGLWVTTVGALAACHEPSGAQPNAAEPTHSAAAAGAPLVVAAVLPGPSLSARFESDAGAVPPSSVAVATDAGIAPVAVSATPAGIAAPELLDAEGKPLPQTDQRPTLSSPSFQQRIDAVAKAIISGDAEPAAAAFFPLVAYQQVKDVAKPERDYRFRLLANFKRDVLEYHHALGAAAADAKFSGVTVSERDTKWMAPGSEGNKLGYFRVLRSHLHFTLPAGRSRDLELTSLISWRGEWYVVHLHGFK